MSESATYSVLLSGSLKSGFEAEQVVDAFSGLFKLSPEKAGAIVGKRFVVKKEVELSVAKAYKEKLGAIGIDARLKRHGGAQDLALEPVELPASNEGEGAQAGSLEAGEMICPKCGLKQSKAEECSGCGVYIGKVPKPEAEPEDSATPTPSTPGLAEEPLQEDAAHADQPVTMKWLIAATIVAVLGALLWYLIAIKLDYEFAAIAWLIGGAIGFASLSSGASGNATGLVCGLLVLLSICGGKYMTVSSQQTLLAEMLSTSEEFEGIDMREFYQQDIADAGALMKLDDDDASLRRFMVDHEYSEFSEVSQVSGEELEMFREYTVPRLRDVHVNRPNFDEWRQYSLGNTIAELSTYDLMVDSLGWMDFLFLFFGIGTAYRLARQGSS